MASITTAQREELLALVVGMFNATPGATNLSALVKARENGATLQNIADALATKPQFETVYPAHMTSDEFADKLIANLLGNEVTDATAKTWVKDWIKGQLAGGKTPAYIITTAITALRATTNTAFTNAKTALANKVEASTYYSVNKGLNDSDLIDLQSAIGTVTSSATSLAAAKTAIDVLAANASGKEFILTTGVDNFTGTVGNDVFQGIPGAGNASTYTALDNLDGAGGTDTLNVTEIEAVAGANAYKLSAAGTVKNIEILNYVVASDDAGDTAEADISSWTGLTTVNVSISGEDGDVTITTKGNATSAAVTGSAIATIEDTATVDTLATVTLNENSGLATITSSALKTLNLNTSAGGATVVAAAGTRALQLNVNGVTAGTVTDAEATTLNVAATGTKSSGITLAADKATTVTLDAAVALTIAAIDVAAATTLTAKGAGAITVTGLTDVAALTAIDGKDAAGGLTIGAEIGNAVAFTGGAGKDSVIVGDTNKAITTGAGNDTVTVADDALGSGGSIDAGAADTDTLKFSAFADAVAASATNTFEGTISNFERLDLGGANAVAAATVNLANLDDINYVTLSATNTETLTIGGLANNGTVAFTANQTVGKDATVSIIDAATGTADVLNVVLSKSTALTGVELIAPSIETVKVTSTETATTLTGTVSHGMILTATAATSLVVSGNAGVTFGTIVGTALTSIDASGVTTGLVSLTTDALAAAATIKGGAGDNTIVATAATEAVTYTGGAKVDTITINNAENNVIDTGAGNDVIVVGTGANTITAGDGNDSITIGASVGLNKINVGGGTDTVILSAAPSAAGFYASVTGMTAGDKFNFAAVTAVASDDGALGAQISLGGAASFANYLDAASAGAGATKADIDWFQFGGNTYVVVDNSNAVTFQDGVDSVIELVGLVDLSAATSAADVLTIA